MLPDMEPGKRSRIQNHAARLSTYAAALCVATAVGLGAYDIYIHQGYVFRDELWWGILLLVAGVLCLATWVISFITDIQQWRDVKRQARFIFVSGRSAVSAGIGFASILAGAYWMMEQTSGAAARFEGILSIYLGVVVVALGITAFYTRFAPITDVAALLREVVNDLREASDDAHVWFVYPALCIGTYRFTRDGIRHKGRPDYVLLSTLIKRVTDTTGGGGRLRMLTYPAAQWQPLFEAYAKQVGDNPDDSSPVQSSVHFAREIVRAALNIDPKSSEHRCVKPADMPQGVIIIGPVVYVLASYGLPQYRERTGFVPLTDPATENGRRSDAEFVELIAFRRVDDELARSVLRHLKHVWEHLAKPDDLDAKPECHEDTTEHTT